MVLLFGVVGMGIDEMASVVKEYTALLREIAESAKPSVAEAVPRVKLGGFYLRPIDIYWVGKALGRLVGLRVRAPYVTVRGAFMHEATIRQVFVSTYGIEVVMSDGLSYRFRTAGPSLTDLVNFAMLIGDDKVREAFTKALDVVREEARRTADFMKKVEKILAELSIK